jgi:hypothetical protein
MDSKLFRLPTKPNFYAAIATAHPFDFDQRQKHTQLAAPDPRYPGWAGQMADGRLVTSYQNHCSRNVPAGQQFATKEWMTKNATKLIDLNRQRYAETTGAGYRFDESVVPPPAAVRSCSKADCGLKETGAMGGIGVERADAAAPYLFGTWEPTGPVLGAPAPAISLTRRYEGGRNTPRGGAVMQ